MGVLCSMMEDPMGVLMQSPCSSQLKVQFGVR